MIPIETPVLGASYAGRVPGELAALLANRDAALAAAHAEVDGLRRVVRFARMLATDVLAGSRDRSLRKAAETVLDVAREAEARPTTAMPGTGPGGGTSGDGDAAIRAELNFLRRVARLAGAVAYHPEVCRSVGPVGRAAEELRDVLGAWDWHPFEPTGASSGDPGSPTPPPGGPGPGGEGGGATSRASEILDEIIRADLAGGHPGAVAGLAILAPGDREIVMTNLAARLRAEFARVTAGRDALAAELTKARRDFDELMAEQSEADSP